MRSHRPPESPHSFHFLECSTCCHLDPMSSYTWSELYHWHRHWVIMPLITSSHSNNSTIMILLPLRPSDHSLNAVTALSHQTCPCSLQIKYKHSSQVILNAMRITCNLILMGDAPPPFHLSWVTLMALPSHYGWHSWPFHLTRGSATCLHPLTLSNLILLAFTDLGHYLSHRN